MANEEHLATLKKSVDAWNRWRIECPDTEPDLREAVLAKADLRGANLVGVDLAGANLDKADLGGTNLRSAHLVAADLIGARLDGAILKWANLSTANLFQANLSRADITEADLSWAILIEATCQRADFRGTTLVHGELASADLRESNFLNADFKETNLDKVNLEKAKFGGTVFVDTDLSTAKGLDAVTHAGPSHIDINTLYRSKGKLPDVFLHGCGVPENFIKLLHMLAAQDKGFQTCSCFISYSTKDQEFVNQLRADLENNGVRCWFAPKDLEVEDEPQSRLNRTNRPYDKVILIISESSIDAEWVPQEIAAAFEQERVQRRSVLFPVRLDSAVMKLDQPWAVDVRRTRHIGDMSGWRESARYHAALDRLVRDLKA